MHFVSREVDGYKIFAVTGTNTVSFAIDFDDADTTGLLGFAVEREDPTEKQRYFMYGMKVFPSVIPYPDEKTTVTTYDHPVQSFVWDDFTAKDGRRYTYWFYPLKGAPRNLDRSATPIEITVETEALFTKGEHDIFFNRGVASSQAYNRRFNNKAPDKQPTPKKRDEALEWLSRRLDDAILAFIKNAKAGDTLLGAFYEFRYEPVVAELKRAVERGVDVRLVLDGKDNSSVDKKTGKPIKAFPRDANREMVAQVGLPATTIARWREKNPANIQHNKFMVLVRGDEPKEVWTGSTNLSNGGIHGQTNVGHWVRNADVAREFAAYWAVLEKDLGSEKGDTNTEAKKKKAAGRKAVMDLGTIPARIDEIGPGSSTIFSPRSGSGVNEMYAATLDSAPSLGAITLAFGVNKTFKSAFADNTFKDPVLFLLLEKRDLPKKNSKTPFIPLTAKQNVYQAWGSYFRGPLYQWTRETNARILGLNEHVSYIHSKFMLRDPLGGDPLVVTGSANFSDPSVNDNDENMLLIRGNERVADIYFTEFNRLYNHYYFRSVQEALSGGKKPEANASADASASLFLKEKASEWLVKYKPGTLRWKRVQAYKRMANTRTL